MEKFLFEHDGFVFQGSVRKIDLFQHFSLGERAAVSDVYPGTSATPIDLLS